jgi:PhoH-like ATPase
MSEEELQGHDIDLSRLGPTTSIRLLDTNVLLDDANAMETFDDSWVFVGLHTLASLNKIIDNRNIYPRTFVDASFAIQALSAYESKGDLKKGVPMGKSLLFVNYDGEDWDGLPEETKKDKKDNTLIGIANGLRKRLCDNGLKQSVIIVSNNIYLRMQANACGLIAQPYNQSIRTMEQLYSGIVRVNLNKDEEQNILPDFRRPNGAISIDELQKTLHGKKLVPNQFVYLMAGSKRQAIGIYNENDRKLSYVDFSAPKLPRSLDKPLVALNPEQACAIYALNDIHKKIVSVAGVAGTGKTVTAYDAGLRQVIGKLYERLVIFKPIREASDAELCALPGGVDDKMAPWVAPIIATLKRLSSKGPKDKNLEQLIKTGVIQIRPINYARGDSIENSFIIVEEAQNLTRNEIKLIITRVGNGSKIVLIGDPTQCDNPRLDFGSTGLTLAIEKFKGHKLGDDDGVCHVTLIESERSSVAALAAKLL